jgi:hypothetical protein
MTRNYRFIICWHDLLGEKIDTTILYWFTCSAISKFTPRLNEQCVTASSTTTEICWEKRSAYLGSQNVMSTRNCVVRDVLEPCAGRLASTVLKGLRGSNVPWLPDRLSTVVARRSGCFGQYSWQPHMDEIKRRYAHNEREHRCVVEVIPAMCVAIAQSATHSCRYALLCKGECPSN